MKNIIAAFLLLLATSKLSAEYFVPGESDLTIGTVYTSCDGCWSNDYEELVMNHKLTQLVGTGQYIYFVIVDNTEREFKTIRFRKFANQFIDPLLGLNVVPNSYKHNIMYDQYRESLANFEHGARYLYQGNLERAVSHIVNVMEIDDFDINWTDNSEFISEVQDLINAELGLYEVNPFFYAHSPMSVVMHTSDNIRVQFAQTNVGPDSSWMLLYAAEKNGR